MPWEKTEVGVNRNNLKGATILRLCASVKEGSSHPCCATYQGSTYLGSAGLMWHGKASNIFAFTCVPSSLPYYCGKVGLWFS